MDKRLLITGGLGYIGSSIAREASSLFQTTVLDRNAESPFRKKIEELGVRIVIGNITEERVWESVEPPDFIVHAAAQTSAESSKEDPVADFATNALGTVYVAEFARRNKSAVLFCSSIRVYNPIAADAATRGPKGCVDETCPLVTAQPIWEPPFAISKLVAESYLQYFSKCFAFPAVILRMSGIVGPGQIGSERHAWIAYLTECAVKGEPYQVFGDGDQRRGILHIDDFVDLALRILGGFRHFAGNDSAVYNVGGGKPNLISLNQVISILQNDHGLRWPIDRTDPRSGEPRLYATDLSRIEQKGWKPMNEDPKKIIDDVVQGYMKRG